MKTHIEAVKDGSIDKMSLVEVRKLIGWFEPYRNDSGKVLYDVVTEDDGGISVLSEVDAHIISYLAQISEFLTRKKESFGEGWPKETLGKEYVNNIIDETTLIICDKDAHRTFAYRDLPTVMLFVKDLKQKLGLEQ